MYLFPDAPVVEGGFFIMDLLFVPVSIGLITTCISISKSLQTRVFPRSRRWSRSIQCDRTGVVERTVVGTGRVPATGTVADRPSTAVESAGSNLRDGPGTGWQRGRADVPDRAAGRSPCAVDGLEGAELQRLPRRPGWCGRTGSGHSWIESWSSNALDCPSGGGSYVTTSNRLPSGSRK